MPRPQSEAQARSRAPVPKARRKLAWKGMHMKLRSKIQHSMIMVITVTLLAAYALTTLVIYRQNVNLMEQSRSELYCKGNRDIRDRLLKADGRGGKEYKNHLN